MSKRTVFSDWLRKQSIRNDAVGDLVKEIIDDPNAPKWAYRFKTWRKYVKQQFSNDSHNQALEQAFHEFVRRS